MDINIRFKPMPSGLEVIATQEMRGNTSPIVVKLNAVPTVPAAVSGLFVMTGALPAAATVIVSVALPVPVAFVAPSNTLVVPVAVGVPVMAPVAVFTVRPAGSGVAL